MRRRQPSSHSSRTREWWSAELVLVVASPLKTELIQEVAGQRRTETCGNPINIDEVIAELLEENVRAKKATSIMLGVVEENQSAYRFWQGLGFELVRQTEPRSFGKKTQVVYVMRKEV